MFSTAIVKTPCENLTEGLSAANLGIPNYRRAREQHKKYIAALKSCGVGVIQLAADEAYPDSTFIEDAALLTPHCAIITRPGAPSRRGEIDGVRPVLDNHYQDIEQIQAPGTVEAGDIMMVGSHYYIGLSERTNPAGANQVIDILEKHGMTGSMIELKKVLHLKTGVAYLEHNNLLASGEFVTHPDFQKFNIIEVDASEGYAANCIWVNEKVLLPQGYPGARNAITRAGYETIEVDVSEFKKLDGGLSCLSLRF